VANHKSAQKRVRQALRQRVRNRQVRGAVRAAVKNTRAALDGGKAADCADALRGAERLIRKAANKGVIPKKRASRHISRLAKRLHKLDA